MNINKYIKLDNSIDSINGEISIKDIIFFFLRNKIVIGSLTLISFVLFCLYSFTLKRTWQGEFQIVLDSPKAKNLNNLNPFVQEFINSSGENDLQTEVGILESPSLLIPIFDFVASKKQSENIKFAKWERNLIIELEKNTSILSISYKDQNKELIIPVLEKLSLAYQDYSGRNKRRNLFLNKDYLNSQIKIYKEKSSNSVRAAQNYAIDQDLIYFGLNNNSNNSESLDKESINALTFNEGFLGANVNIEKIRVQAANQIRTINLQIKKINELESTDYENLQYFGSSIPVLSQDGLPEKLKEIESELVVLRSKYTENDPSVIRLLQQRALVVDLLKSRAIKYLKIVRLEIEALMEAAMRPKEMILEYKELLREAASDEATLVSLEKQLRILELEEERYLDPWQLITKPTLLDSPIAPNKILIGLLGLFFGLIIGILISYYRENKSGKVLSESIFVNIFNAPIIEKLSIEDLDLEKDLFVFFREFLRNNSNKKICLFLTPEINKEVLFKLKNKILNTNDSKNLNKVELIYNYEGLNKFVNAEERILVSMLGNAEIENLKKLSKNLTIYNLNLSGIILLS